jgi:hypothetical protein
MSDDLEKIIMRFGYAVSYMERHPYASKYEVVRHTDLADERGVTFDDLTDVAREVFDDFKEEMGQK